MSLFYSRGRGSGGRRPAGSRNSAVRSGRGFALPPPQHLSYWPPECSSPPESVQYPPVRGLAPECTSPSRQDAEDVLEPLEFELKSMRRVSCMRPDEYEFELASMREGLCAQPAVHDTTGAVHSAAKAGVEALWKVAQEAQSAVRQASGHPASDDDRSPGALLKRAQRAELELRKAAADLRLARAELMLCIGAEGHALQSTACWETCGSWPVSGNGIADACVERCTDCHFTGKLYLDEGGYPYCAQCWYECYQEWPSSKDLASYKRQPPCLMLKKYEVHLKDVLGKGGFSTVRRGRDVKTGEVVAVKTYSAMEDMDPGSPEFEEDKTFFLSKFRHEVETFQQLHALQDVCAQIGDLKRAGQNKRNSWYIPEGLSAADSSMMDIFSELPSCSELFVQLLDFSKDGASMPAPSPDTGDCCVVLELAEYTLDEFLSWRYKVSEPLDVNEVREIFHQLAQVIAVLHAKHFVHCDLKPANVMYFASGRWKLIDMDGMVTTGKSASLCDVFYTPHYCAPEFALSCLESEDLLFEVSRLLDVWSLGMIAVELVTFEAVLRDKYNSFGEDNYEEFLAWLADRGNKVVVPPKVAELDPQLNHLCCQMLEKDQNLRASMVEVLVHPFFTSGVTSGGIKCVEEKRLRNEEMKKRNRASQPKLLPLGGGHGRRASGTVVRRRSTVQLAELSRADQQSNLPATSPSVPSSSERELDLIPAARPARRLCTASSAFSDVSDVSRSSRGSHQPTAVQNSTPPSFSITNAKQGQAEQQLQDMRRRVDSTDSAFTDVSSADHPLEEQPSQDKQPEPPQHKQPESLEEESQRLSTLQVEDVQVQAQSKEWLADTNEDEDDLKQHETDIFLRREKRLSTATQALLNFPLNDDKDFEVNAPNIERAAEAEVEEDGPEKHEAAVAADRAANSACRTSLASNSIGAWSDRTLEAVPSTRSVGTELPLAKDPFSMESWPDLVEKARGTQRRAASICQLLRNTEEAAAAMEELWRAAAKAETTLWREAGGTPVPETLTAVPEPSAAMELQVASAGRELRAASSQLLQHMDDLQMLRPEATSKAAPKVADMPLISGCFSDASVNARVGTPLITST